MIQESSRVKHRISDWEQLVKRINFIALKLTCQHSSLVFQPFQEQKSPISFPRKLRLSRKDFVISIQNGIIRQKECEIDKSFYKLQQKQAIKQFNRGKKQIKFEELYFGCINQFLVSPYLQQNQRIYCEIIIPFMIQTMKQSEQENHRKNGQIHKTLFARIKQFLFMRNYTLATSLKLTLAQAIILIIIEEFQKIAIVTRYSVNPTLNSSPEMFYVAQICRVFLFDLFAIDDQNNLVITILLILGQILVCLAIIIPFKGEIINEIISKYVITFLEMTITLPSLALSLTFIVQGINIGPNIILYLLSMATNIISESMQIECSFERQNDNPFVRTGRPITFKILHLIALSIFPIITHYLFSVSFAMYSLYMLLIQLYNWMYYLSKFIYFNETLMYVKGVMLTVNVSAYFCYLLIYTLDNAIISQNILLFITTFSIFLGNFFITMRKYALKNTIINKDLKGQNEIGLYCVFYWHCFTKITEKKNQLYVSSLLKKHTNQCQDLTCCCKNRQYLYDTYLKSFGNPKIQPHFDKIFIRHFIRKLLNDGYQKFNKSSLLAILLSNYNIEVVEMITQTMELIRKLSKMQQKKQLYFTQQFLLHCLKMKTHNRILNINLKQGNADLQSVKEFDQQLVCLHENLKNSIRMYHNLWKQLQHANLNQNYLYDICKNNLQLMFTIEKTYKKLKSINTESTELRSIMLFYAKLVLHDIHLLSEVKKDIKNGHQRNSILSNLQLSNMQLFGSNTATFISLENGKIKWTSKNAHQIFEYGKQEFRNISIKNLMPKYFADKHDGYIERWKSTGHHIKLNSTSYLWGSTKNGVCFSMLMFVKAIPLLQDQEHAFFSCIEKLDDQSQLICNAYGDVYGAGKLFSSVININPRVIQEIRMNIGVFIPYTFDYFVEYFYPNNTRLKNIKKNFQVRREGYFPQNLDIILKDYSHQRKLFLQKYEKEDGFGKQYLNFVRQQMQQLTCNINGQYISLSIFPFKVTTFQNQSQNIINLKLSNAKKGTIEKYYGQLEKMISKLQNLTNQQNSHNKYSKSVFKRAKSDFFKVFLNPKRMKRLLEKEQEQLAKGRTLSHEQQQQIKRDITKQIESKSKPTKNIVAHRKKLALGAKIEIKNDRVRYNIYKMKKILLEQGVISRFTYNILIGKHITPPLISEANIDQQNSHQNKSNDLEEERIISEEDKNSINHDSDGELAADKQNDNQTFNSASSSATFISMTNHVKLFKIKLRSLNTPRPLMLLNIVVIGTLLAGIIGLIYLNVQSISNLQIGLKQFKVNQDANIIVDGLFLGQLNILNLNESPNNTYFLAQRQYFLENVSSIYKTQMYLRAYYKQIDDAILKYLTVMIHDDQNITVREFISLVLDQIIKDSFDHVMFYFTQTMSTINTYSHQNSFFSKIQTNIFMVFIIYFALSIILFLATLPIIWKIQVKIKEIYGLLKKISINDKQKYFKHFSNINDEFKNKEEINSDEFNNLMVTYQNKVKFLKSNTRAGFSEEFIPKVDNQKHEVEVNVEKDSSVSGDKSIYFKISIVYLILIASVVFNYIFLTSYHRIFQHANEAFMKLFNYKTLLTSRIIQGQYELMDYRHETNYSSTTIELVDALYSTYSMDGISEKYKQYVNFFTTKNPCNLIKKLINYQEFCNTLNNKTFSQGGIDNLYYSLRKIQQKVTEHYIARNYTPNNEDNVVYPQYFFTEEYVQLNVGYFYSTLMIYDLFSEIQNEISRLSSNYKLQFFISLSVSLLLIFLFSIFWIYIYLKLAENASYINAFLLLIPFDVLNENPYIKLYIRNQFDYKANY